MSQINVIRAWKDEDYRMGLSDEERFLLPDNPAGFMELTETELQTVTGGSTDIVSLNCINSIDCNSAGCTGVIAICNLIIDNEINVNVDSGGPSVRLRRRR